MQSILQPIQKRSSFLKEEVYNAIKSAILAGSLAPGQRLTLTDLSEILEVSRTPVRDAVTRLEAENLVQSLNNKGILVIGISQKDIYDIFEIRVFSETVAAMEACKKRVQSDIEGLSWFTDMIRQATHERNVAQYNYYNEAFHYMLFEISKKTSLYLVLGTYREYCKIVRAPEDFEETEFIQEAFEDHLALVKAIEFRNETAAREIAEGHLLRTRDKLLRAYWLT